MIKHIVLLKIKEGILEDKIEECFKAVSGLKNKIEGIISIDSGKDNSPENKNQGYLYGFTVYFKDSKSRDKYISHPEHQKVIKEFIAPIIKDALVFDYEIKSTTK